jgi:hypothetical protein
MTKEALNLALEALEYMDVTAERYVDKQIPEKAITAIKEALAESEPNYKKALEVWLDKTEWVQETVKPHELGMHRADVLKQRIEEALAQPEHGWTPERIAGMARLKEAQDKKLAQVEQPKVRTGNCLRVGVCASEGHKIAPQRTWVGLTDEDKDFIVKRASVYDWHDYEVIEATEAKLKEKNT